LPQALAHVDVYRRWPESCPQIELISEGRTSTSC
jgi:hypothetical protein